MRTIRDIRKRIRSVRNTQKITRAMKMVSAAKLRRAQSRLTSFRSYSDACESALRMLLSRAESVDHPFLENKNVKGNTIIIQIAGDRGLCGSYNVNIFKEFEKFRELHRSPGRYDFIAIGRRSRDYAKKKGYNILKEYVMLGGFYSTDISNEIKEIVTNHFISGEATEVYLLYSRFVSALSQKPAVRQLLPVKLENLAAHRGIDYIYEPDLKSVLNLLLHQYIFSQIHRGLLEASASEFGARMTAMDSATNNASEMIDILTLQMNRSRQASITKELMDIINGVEAIK
jgi:F-type H+-transporting ATPase subunit gamma